MKALKERGVTPEWVQIGNEIPGGMLWPGGRSSTSPENLVKLINEGHRAVKASDPRIKVILHLNRGNDNAQFRWSFDLMEKHGAEYDVIGLSYYPFRLPGKPDYTRTIEDFGNNLTDMAARYRKQVMVVEVGGEDTQAANTRAMLGAVIEKTRAVPGNQGLGVIYWEPQAAAVRSRYKLSCWNADRRPTEALEAFLEMWKPSAGFAWPDRSQAIAGKLLLR